MARGLALQPSNNDIASTTDLIISKIVMPAMAGVELATKQLQQHKAVQAGFSSKKRSPEGLLSFLPCLPRLCMVGRAGLEPAAR